ncbi:MAG: SAM-dependent methyltransferase, partial [Mesorhizobium sp.]
MNVDKANAALDSVYTADTPKALAEAYAAWAATYDSETASLGYLLPFLIAAWVARHVPSGEGPLLDAGCGTGLSGPSLRALGYRDIAGLDLSEEYFRAFFSTGVFTISHAPASGLYELVRITKKGGHAIFTVRDQVFESGGFRDVFAELEHDEKWRPVEE